MDGHVDFADAILTILGQATASGNFHKTVEMASGKTVTYTFSQAVGIGSQASERSYIDQFKQPPPDWALIQHPYHLTSLCRLAIDRNTPLPEKYPTNNTTETL